MSRIQSSQDHLPYIDRPPSPTSIASARALITSTLPASSLPPLHPSLPPAREPTFTPTLTASLALLSDPPAQKPGIDLDRYSPPTAPTSADKESWTAALRAAYISRAYLSDRATNLALLETYGRNAWLVGNAQLEDELRALEGEVAEGKRELEAVEGERRGLQEGSSGEVGELESAWKKGVGRLLEVRIEGERLRGEIEERRRVIAGG